MIAPASLRDVKGLHELEKICFQLDAWPLLDVIGILTLPQIIRLKAVDDQIMAGFIGIDLRRAQEVAWIATLAVHPDYRRKGLAARLLELGEARTTLPRIRLSVRQSNYPAISLYERFGYQQVDTWKKYYRGGDDALVFDKILR